jgi:hypothetical protein
MEREAPLPAIIAGMAAATMLAAMASAACSGPQTTGSSLPADGPAPGQSHIPTATVRRAPHPLATPSPTPASAPLQSAADFTLPQAGGPDFNLAEQLAHGSVVIAFFRQGGG